MGRFKLPHVEDLSLRVRALRYFMTIFCFFFVVFGAGVLASAAILAAGRPAECSFLEEFLTGVYLLLAAGCLTVFFCLITFRHIYRSSSSGDFTSVLFVLVVVMVMQVIAAIAGHVHNARASESGGGGLESAMNLTWREYYHHHHHDQDSRACVDRLQKEFACCGVLNGDAEWLWLALSANLSVPRPYPSSCLCSAGSDDADGGEECMVRNDSFSNAGGSAAHVVVRVWGSPCREAVRSYLFDTLLVPRVVGPVITVVEFFLLLAASYVLHHIDNRSMVGAYVVTTTTTTTTTTTAEAATDVASAPREDTLTAESEFGETELQERLTSARPVSFCRGQPKCHGSLSGGGGGGGRDESTMHM